MTECEHLIGRMRDLCEGRGFDGRPHPSQSASDNYRASIGLPPIPVTPADVVVHGGTARPVVLSQKLSAPVVVSSIGTTLSELFKSRVGQVPCGWCKTQIAALNGMTVSEVRDRADDLTAAIIRNAKEKANWWVKLSIWADEKGHAGVVSSVVKAFIEEACSKEEAGAKVE